MATLAKLTRPRLYGALPRHRLFALLDERRIHPAIWIHGPPGAGKTTLVASYPETREHSTLWYQVDSGDTDPATFFYYLRQAVTQITQGEAFSLPLLTPEYLPDLPGFARRSFRELFRHLSSDAVLVLDDTHQATPSPVFCGLLERAVNEIPDGANIIFVSRTPPPQELSRALALARLVTVGWEDLRLSLAETQAIATDAGVMADSGITALHDYCDGWAAGLTLILAGHKRLGDIDLSARASRESVFNYFAAEIFAQLPDDARDVLLRVAYFPSITEKTAVEISGNNSAAEILDDLYRRHYFTTITPGRRTRYVFHALFRDFLLNRARQVFNADEHAGLAQRAAYFLEQEGQTEDAAALYIESGAWPELARLVCQNGPVLMAQGRGGLLEPWINPIPAAMLDANPWLHYWQGMARLPFNPPASRPSFECAFNLFKTWDDIAGMYLTLAAMLESHFYTYTLPEADPWIEEVEQLIARHPRPPSVEIEAQFLASMNCMSFRQPQHPLLESMAERAQALGETLTDPVLRLRVSVFAYSYRIYTGEFIRVKTIIDTVSACLAQKLPPLASLMWSASKSVYDWHTAAHEVALKMVEDGLQLAESSGIHVMDTLLCSQGVYTCLSMGNTMRAETYLAKMQNSPIPLDFMGRCHYQILRAGLLLAQGDAQTAAAILTATLPLAEQAGWFIIIVDMHIQLAQALIELGDHTTARHELSVARQLIDQFPSHILKVHLLRATAQSFFATGEEEQGVAALRQVFKIAREQAYMNWHPWWIPKVMSQLCARALDAGIEVPYVQTLIKARGLIPATLDVEHWPWPVRIYTLGRFSVVIDGQPLDFAGKSQGKPLALLKALLALGGREVGEDKLIDLLWPEADGDNGHSVLTMTLKRLRTLLGNSETIRLRDARLTLNPQTAGWIAGHSSVIPARRIQRLPRRWRKF